MVKSLQPVKNKPFTLADLGPGECAEVIGLTDALQELERHRLLDLGFVPLTTVRTGMSSALGGLRSYHVRGAQIALRPHQARQIQAKPVS